MILMSKFAQAIKEWERLGMNIERCTCNLCNCVSKCQYAYDIYNVDDDCIMEK